MYIFIKDYFIDNDDDSITIGRHSFWATFDSKFSQKALSNLYALGKPYVSFEGEEEEVVAKPKSKIKKKKVKIDEPKAEPIINTEPNEEES
jgi:hypothetical protein